MLEHINTGNYKEVKKNPLSKIIKNVKTLIKNCENEFFKTNGKIDKQLKCKLNVPNPKLLVLYGLPKIHKTGPLKMRLIVSNIDSPNYKIAKWFVNITNTLEKPPHSSIKNSF